MLHKNDRGVTIVETLIAISIMALIMAAAFPLAEQTLTRIYMTRDHYIAATICQARIERARNRLVSYDSLFQMQEDDSEVDDFGNRAEWGGRFCRSTNVTTNDLPDGLIQMKVTTKICLCTRLGWKRFLHPMAECGFTDDIKEEMTYIFTEYE